MLIDSITQNQLRQIHNPDGSKLREMQLKMKEILDVVHMICEKNNIPYWLSSGTLLGAVRHGGFIPWDDDVDIDMLWSDIPRFIKACEKDLPEGYIVQTHKTDKHYYLNHIKVRDLNSSMSEPSADNYKYKGLFVDIIPIEPSFLLLNKLSRYPKALVDKSVYMNMPRFIQESCYYLRQIIFLLFRFISCFKSNKNECYPTYGTLFFNKRDLTDIFPTSMIEFEGSTFSAPKEYDAYLSKMFGDYAKLPANQLRRPQHDASVI